MTRASLVRLVAVATWLLIVAGLLAVSLHPVWAAPASLGLTATGDDSTAGTATSYDLRWSTTPPHPDSMSQWWAQATPIGNLPAPLPAGAHQVLAFTLPDSSRRYFLLRVADEAENWSPLSNVAAWPGDTLPRPAGPPKSVTDLRLGGAGPTGQFLTHSWVGVLWTWPDSGVTVVHRARDGSGVEFSLPLYALPDLLSGPPVRGTSAGAAWIRFPRHNNSGAGEPTINWLVVSDAKGQRSDSSNALVIRFGDTVPIDTLAYDQTVGQWMRTQGYDVGGMATHAREWGDNRWIEQRPPGVWQGLPLVATQEEIQRADRDALCALFGYWCLWGAQQACGAPETFWMKVRRWLWN